MSSSAWADLLAPPVRLLAFFTSILPLKWAQTLGNLLGLLWYHVLPIRRRVVLENLQLALPELTLGQRRRIARETFRHVAVTVVELFWLTPRRRPRLDDIVEVRGLEHYERIRDQGRGVIALTAHLGNWDLLACSQGAAGVPLSIVTKELSSRGLNRFWMERRAAMNVKLLPAQGSMLSILRALRKAEVVGLVVDQRTPKSEGGKPLPFFGSPALTTLAPHVLAARTGAALLPLHSYRNRDGAHIVHIGAELEPGQSAEETMTKVNELLESWIRENPGQWLWLHRRWANLASPDEGQ